MRCSWTAAAWLAIGTIALAQSPAAWEGKTVRQWIDQATADDLGTRWYAIYVLGQLGPQAADAVAPLQQVLAKRSEQEYVRGTAAWALGRMGPAAAPAVPLLIETMHSKGHVSVRRNANQALGDLAAAAKPAVPELRKALDDDDAVTRVAAAVALVKIEPSEKALAPLIEMLRRGKEPAAYEAAVALGTLAADLPPAACTALVEALGSADADVRRAAARALGQIGSSALPALAKALEDPRDEVRRLAVEALGWMGPAALAPLTAALGNTSAAARRAAARALGRLGPAAKTAEAELVHAVNDPREEVRAVAAAALLRIRADAPAK